MNPLQRESAIKRLQGMSERLPDGSFDKTAVNAAVGDMMLQIPGQVKYGGGAWRCFQCGAAVEHLEVFQGFEEWLQKQAKKQATSDKSSD